MVAKTSELKDILIEELEGKKPFDAMWSTDCNICGNSIEEGDEFFFFGDKQKVCGDCKAEMINLIEGI